MSFIVAGCALLMAVFVGTLLGVKDVERQQKAQELLNLGSFRP
jgi:hypothetical protein